MTGETFHLAYREPYDWPAMLAFLAARAVAGVERVEGGVYRRSLEDGSVEVRHVPERSGLSVTTDVPRAVERLHRVFDLEADVRAIGAHLSLDPLLAPSIAARPGLRVPGAWDGFELAVRAVLGQQVTVRAGRVLAERLLALCGTPAFPSAPDLLAADLSTLGMPGARRAALTAVAEAAVADPHLFEPGRTLEDAVARLRAIPGVGEWTAQYIALRALRHADAFPASDIGLLRGAGLTWGTRPTPAELHARAERWRPYRAYAAQHLWAADSASACHDGKQEMRRT